MTHDKAFYTLHNLSCPFDVMRFYLVYRGPLRSTQSKHSKTRHQRIEIRKQTAPQMKRLWETHTALRQLQWDARVHDGSQGYFADLPSPLTPRYIEPPTTDPPTGFVDLTGPIIRHGKPFRPLVRKSLDLTCSLNILFLRQEEPGNLIKKAGDIDNRIKTFIDALEMPAEELDGDEIDEMNYPLLERDSLVKGLTVNTERLLLPESESVKEVHLICEVIVHIERVGVWNVSLL